MATTEEGLDGIRCDLTKSAATQAGIAGIRPDVIIEAELQVVEPVGGWAPMFSRPW